MVPDRQVAGLEQQRFRRHVAHVEGGQQFVGTGHPLQRERAYPALDQRFDQEPGRAGLEPVGGEFAAVEQQEDVEGIVDPFPSEPAVAVVPAADLVPVESGQLRREHGVQVRVGVTADAGVARVQGDVAEVVESGEQAHLRELTHAGNEREPDVGVAVLDHRIEAAQEVPIGAGDVRRLQRIQNRLVVLVHQHHYPLSGPAVQRREQRGEAPGGRGVVSGHLRFGLGGGQLLHDARLKEARLFEIAGAEAEPQHRVADRPVVAAVDVQTVEQRLVALEQLLQCVEEQALAEAPGAREEVVGAFLDQPPDVGGLVDVVAALLTDRAEGLDADGQLASGTHGEAAYLTCAVNADPGRSGTRAGRRTGGRTSMHQGSVRAPPTGKGRSTANKSLIRNSWAHLRLLLACESASISLLQVSMHHY